MKASSFGEGKEIKPGLNYNYWGRQSSAHLSCRTAAQESLCTGKLQVAQEEKEICHHSRYPVQTSRSAIIYYRPLHVIFPFDWRRTAASKMQPLASLDISCHLIKQWIFNSTQRQLFISSALIHITDITVVNGAQLRVSSPANAAARTTSE